MEAGRLANPRASPNRSCPPDTQTDTPHTTMREGAAVSSAALPHRGEGWSIASYQRQGLLLLLFVVVCVASPLVSQRLLVCRTAHTACTQLKALTTELHDTFHSPDGILSQVIALLASPPAPSPNCRPPLLPSSPPPEVVRRQALEMACCSRAGVDRARTFTKPPLPIQVNFHALYSRLDLCSSSC